MIYKIENEEVQPSLEISIRLSQALNVSLGTMVNEGQEVAGRVFRQDQQMVWQDEESGIVRRALMPTSYDNDWFLSTFPPHVNSSWLPTMPNKASYIYVLSGTATVNFMDGEDVVVHQGETFIVPRGIGKHRVSNTHDEPCEIFYVVTAGDSF